MLSAGDHEIIITVRTANGGLLGSCATHVLVRDSSSISLSCPREMVVRCQDEKGAQVFYEGVRAVTERCRQVVPVTCEPPSGTLFPPGTTIVKCFALDAAGQRVECSFPVQVICDAPRVSVSRGEGNRVRIVWQGYGILESADSLAGPWRAVPTAVSGYTLEPIASSQFFRIRLP
jgi:hypothetical protein